MGMSVKISRWRDGYVLARLEERESGCGSAERFLNLCRARGIDLWDIRPSETGLEVCMAAGGVRACREPLRKAGVRLRILKKRGLPFALRRGRKKKGFLVGLAACCLLLWGLSLFIWDIEIEGERMYSQDTLIRYLESRNHGVIVHLRDGEQSFAMPLAEAERLLPAGAFQRCHKSYLVNLTWVERATHAGVLLKDSSRLPMSRTFYSDFQNAIVRRLNT